MQKTENYKQVQSMKEYEIILDTDIGDDIDDAYALALLMAENA